MKSEGLDIRGYFERVRKASDYLQRHLEPSPVAALLTEWLVALERHRADGAAQ